MRRVLHCIIRYYCVLRLRNPSPIISKESARCTRFLVADSIDVSEIVKAASAPAATAENCDHPSWDLQWLYL
jgi:hypothetical protein